jgi:serine/threonine protein phosphatase PrpC
MSVDLSSLLQSAYVAFSNDQLQQSMFLLNYAIKLADEYKFSHALSPLDAAICLERGRVRQENEDCVLALHGLLPETGKVFGLFIICDGMGGHAYGQEAACMATRTIVESVFPLLMHGSVSSNDRRSVLAKGVEQANRVIYMRNQWQASHGIHATLRENGAGQTGLMGTTVSAVLLLDATAYVANVGDSRTYLYTPKTELTRITSDHSIVATLLAQREITEEEVYSHPQRNQITRCLGHTASIEIDSFIVSLPENAVLLLCSDGLWEMTRDPQIAATLNLNGASAEQMARQLLRLAMEGGAFDNIGFVVVKPDGHARKNGMSNQVTMWNRLVQASARPAFASQ